MSTIFSTPSDFRGDQLPLTGGGSITLVVDRAVTAVTGHPQPQAFPVAIPASQLYFWTRRWQEGERDADSDISRGAVKRFPDAKSAIAWLLEADE